MQVHRKKKLLHYLSLALALTIIVGFVLYALRANINVYYTPAQLKGAPIKPGTAVRVGGYVVNGSLIHEAETQQITFALTDHHASVVVKYQGILPNLFAEEKGAVVEGIWQGQFLHASRVLAKHDENYRPPDVVQPAYDQKLPGPRRQAPVSSKLTGAQVQ